MAQKAIILIAEDDVNLSEILKSKLVSLGYDVFTAHNGEEAEKLITEKNPDLALLDIMMPKKSGLEVLESVVKNPKTKDIAAFMLSNLGQKKDIDKATSLGAKDYIVKANSSLAEIVQKMDQYLKANPPKERPAQTEEKPAQETPAVSPEAEKKGPEPTPDLPKPQISQSPLMPPPQYPQMPPQFLPSTPQQTILPQQMPLPNFAASVMPNSQPFIIMPAQNMPSGGSFVPAPMLCYLIPVSFQQPIQTQMQIIPQQNGNSGKNP